MKQLAAALALLLLAPVSAVAGAQSGPPAGGTVLPFTSNMVTGANRGRQHCYVCELKDEPAILVFARGTSPATASLLRQLTDAVGRHRDRKLFGWFVFLGEKGAEKELAREREVYEFVRRQGATALPVSALGDPEGPPGYRISPQAEVTILYFRNRKVTANRSWSASEWNAAAASGALAELPLLLQSPAEP